MFSAPFLTRSRLLIVGLAVIIRLALLPGRGFPDDIHCFASWMHALVMVGPRGLYADTSNTLFPAVDYPPGYLYILWVFGWLEHVLIAHPPSALVDRVFEKLPASICDFGVAYVAAKLAQKLWNERIATQVFAVLLLSPVLWLISAYWGQVDAFAGLGVLLCLLSAYHDRYVAMWCILALTVLIKPQPIVLAPFLALFQVKHGSSRHALWQGPLAALGLTYIVALPAAPTWFLPQTFAWLFARYTFGMAKYPNGSSGAFNLYTVVGNAFQPDTVTIAGISLHTIGICAVVIALIALSLSFWRYVMADQVEREPAAELHVQQTRALVYVITLALIALFLGMTRMHERYEMSAVVLLPLLFGFGKIELFAALLLGGTFCLNAVAILLGFYGGHHHPQILLVVHLLSLANIAAWLTLCYRWFSTHSCKRAFAATKNQV